MVDDGVVRTARRASGCGSNRAACSFCFRSAVVEINARARDFAICQGCLDAINRLAAPVSGSDVKP